jgi:two-component system sensor histidine kinase/response regulator
MHVISDVLDFARIESGEVELERIPFSMADQMQACVAMLKSTAEVGQVELTYDMEPQTPTTLIGDPKRLGQILLNLAGNAVKFTPPGGQVRLTLRCLETTANRTVLQLDVVDTGVGLSSEQMANMFKPFTQADASTTRKFGGTGLGLAISIKLADAMGATLRAQSELGVGTTFSLTLPLEVSNQLPSQVATTPPPRIGAYADMHVLVVDDDRLNRHVTSAMLSKLGASVATAASGQEAIQLVAEHSFNVIFMDCRMPEIDGFETTRRLRSMGHEGHVVAFTASVTGQERENAKASGMNEFMTKPVRLADLEQVLTRTLHDRR